MVTSSKRLDAKAFTRLLSLPGVCHGQPEPVGQSIQVGFTKMNGPYDRIFEANAQANTMVARMIFALRDR